LRLAAGGAGLTLPLATGPSAYWYATRGAGVVALLLLTASLVIGIVDFSRWQSERWPRFVIDGVHRAVSLLAVAFVAVHVATTVADGFTSIDLVDAVVPFAASYRPLWLGLGTLALDLLLALTLTSVLRRRLGHSAWRAVHWTAYACWPLALVHGLGTGTDTTLGWMLLLTLLCTVAVLAAVGWRASAAAAGDRRRGTLVGAVAASAVIALVIWVVAGPLGPNWASRAGTPATLLASVKPSAGAGPATAARDAAATSLRVPFSARLRGTVDQRGSAAAGVAVLDIRTKLHGGAAGSLEIQIQGQPLGDGGVSMTASRVALGPPGEPSLYRGRLVALRGTRLLGRVSDGTGSVELDVNLAIDQATRGVSGTATARPVGAVGSS
jgi:DMSO/TMAO reductase YedYZ heme-binding membrane subunit